MWPFSSTASDSPVFGEYSEKLTSHFRQVPRLGRRRLITVGLVVTSGLSLFLITDLSLLLGRGPHDGGPGSYPPPPPPPSPHQEQAVEYNTASCVRLDSIFEFESPPDFAKLGIETYTECRRVKATEGWEIEHCTAPGSTWMDTTGGDMIENFDSSNRFLFRPKARTDGQQHAYSAPPASKVHTQFRPSGDIIGRDKPSQCNPSGYFRVQRLNTPSSTYTEGSSASRPENRCRPRSDKPLSTDASTRSYIDDFTGPDSFRAVIDGPEYYVANQQINLGNCTYAIPYVLSRPGKFWLTEIEHIYDDYAAMNENYDGQFYPIRISKNILPVDTTTLTAPGPDAGFSAYKTYKKTIADVYQFTVCTGCPQFLHPETQQKYENWVECSVEPIKAAREYGVYSRRYPVQEFEDLAKSGYEWTPETIRSSIGEGSGTVRAYGAPPTAPATIEQFEIERKKTADCAARDRKIYFAGDSHVRQLLTGLSNRFHGDSGEIADFKGWTTHTEQLSGIFIRQDFDQWFEGMHAKTRYMVDPNYVPFSYDPEIMALIEQFDTVVVEFGSWPASGFGVGPMWDTVKYMDFLREILWNLGQMKKDRRAYFKKTGFGFDDLTILWMGSIPWPDIRTSADMRTNIRIQYWDDLINSEIDAINEKYKDMGGAIDNLDAYSKFLPHRRGSPDGAHHMGKQPVDAIVQVLAHKFDLCRPAFTPKFPPPATAP
ncbi:hypothetical protein BGZ83_002039 [Gryganskiella cystojenkinii]|nr:hypothetical protein BGZ83_002039 [Gryganskiella cystojenkinii]